MERKKHERNKRYGILVALLLINWLAILGMVFFVDPSNVSDIFFTNSYLPMMILIFGGLFWVFTIVFLSAKRALRWTSGAILFIYLRIWGMGNLLNAGLIFGLLGSLELYLWTKKSPHLPVAQNEE